MPANGVGDACEWVLPQLVGATDTDGDGVIDSVDNCWGTPNPSQSDLDQDGIGDTCDNCRLFANADQRDDDHNGIGDACEHCQQWSVEYPLWGVGREGMATRDTNAVLFDNWVVADTFRRQVHRRHYEVQDHMGTARVVIADVKGVPSANHFQWGIEASTETYPFGMAHPRRSGGSYRYGWQGMERDTSATAGGYVTPFREYDARLGRWLSVDPVTHSGESPYVAMGDNPVNRVDPTGAKSDGPGDDEKEEVSPAPTSGDPVTGGADNPLDPNVYEETQKKEDGSAVTYHFERNNNQEWTCLVTTITPDRYVLSEVFLQDNDGQLRRANWSRGVISTQTNSYVQVASGFEHSDTNMGGTLAQGRRPTGPLLTSQFLRSISAWSPILNSPPVNANGVFSRPLLPLERAHAIYVEGVPEERSGFWFELEKIWDGNDFDGYTYNEDGKLQGRNLLRKLEFPSYVSPASGFLKPLGLGSTGRTIANTLEEQLAMEEILSNPNLGQIVMKGMNNPLWKGWDKLQYVHRGLDGSKITIHFVALIKNGIIQAIDDFKFK